MMEPAREPSRESSKNLRITGRPEPKRPWDEEVEELLEEREEQQEGSLRDASISSPDTELSEQAAEIEEITQQVAQQPNLDSWQGAQAETVEVVANPTTDHSEQHEKEVSITDLASDLSEGLPLQEEISADIKGVFTSEPSDRERALIQQAAAFRDDVSADPDSYVSRARELGRLTYLTALVNRDPALIEAYTKGRLPASTRARNRRPSMTPQQASENAERTELLLDELMGTSLKSMGELLRREFVGHNSLVETNVLRGMLEPYLWVSKVADRRGVLTVLFGRSAPQQGQDLSLRTLTKEEGDFLRKLADRAAAPPIDEGEPQAPIELSEETDCYQYIDPKLRTLVENVTAPMDRLVALDVYLTERERGRDEMTLADLDHFIGAIPQGVKWGSRNSFQTLSVSAGYYESHSDFEPADIALVYRALELTGDSLGEEHAARIGENVRGILYNSVFNRMFSGNSSSFKEKVKSNVLEKLGKTLGAVVGTKSGKRAEIEKGKKRRGGKK